MRFSGVSTWALGSLKASFSGTDKGSISLGQFNTGFVWGSLSFGV